MTEGVTADVRGVEISNLNYRRKFMMLLVSRRIVTFPFPS
jgi:hypothetical protein